MRFIIGVLVILFNYEVLASCPLKFKNRQEKKMINISLSNIVKSLDPTIAWNYQHFLLLQSSTDTLVKHDQSGRVISSIAKKWEIKEGGRSVLFHLDEKAKFHNGEIVNSSDVARSISMHFYKGSKSVVAPYLKFIIEGADKELKDDEIISGIKIHSSSLLEFRLHKAYPPFFSVMSMPGFAVVKKDGLKIHGSGAYQAFFKDDHIVLKLNREYHQKLPTTEEFCVKYLLKPESIVEEIEKKELDLSFGVPVSSFRNIKKSNLYELVKTNTIVTLHGYVNPNGILRDEKKRAGIAKIITEFNYRHPEPLHTPQSTFIPDGFLSREYYVRNKEKAVAFESKVKVKLVYHESYFSKSYVDSLLQYLISFNVDADITLLPADKFYHALDSKEFDLIHIPYMANFSDPDGFMELLVPGQVFSTDFSEIVKFNNKIQDARFISSAPERLKTYADIFLSFENANYVIPLSKVSLPLLKHMDVHLPDTSYKYEADLRNIFWDIKK